MLKRLNLFYLLFIFLFGLLINLTTPFLNLAQAQAATDASYGLNSTANQIDAFAKDRVKVDSAYTTFFQTKIGQVIGLVLSFIGVVFLILMIYAGIIWMTSQGNDQNITKAKDLIISSIVGLIIVLAAYAITSFIGAQLLK